MQELRIALTVLPVGPRGDETLQTATDQARPLCFALQIAAGFAEPESAGRIDELWPWVLHVVNAQQKVELQATVLDAAGAVLRTFAVDAGVPAPEVFATRLREAIKDAHTDADTRAALDMRLLLPGEADASGEDHQRASFSARQQYLATLPGELSRRLLATLYVFLPVNELFEKNASGVWVAKGHTLWIAPRAVSRPGGAVTLGNFRRRAAGIPLFEAGGINGVPVAAIGPGFALARFIDPASTPFDLKDYKLPVVPGDRRFVEIETVLLDVLDPFGQLDHLQATPLGDALTLTQGGQSRLVPPETFAVLLALWRVRAFAGELRALLPSKGIEEIAKMLLPHREPMPAFVVPARWDAFAEESGGLLELTATLATRLGLAVDDQRSLPRGVAERAGFTLVASWLAQAFDETLAATSAAPQSLRDAWRFGGASGNELAERRAALALAAVTQLREKRDLPGMFDALKRAALPDASANLRAEAMTRLTKVWDERRDAKVLAALVTLTLASAAEQLQLAQGADDELASAYLDAVWPETPARRTELPGRGLQLRAGKEEQRLVHEDNSTADDPEKSPYREIAGVLLLARRGKDETDLAAREWRILTAGAAMIGPLGERLFAPGQTPEIKVDEDWLRELLPLPLRPVFQQKVARADLEYHGQPLLAQSALDRAYAAEDYVDDDAPGLLPAYSFHPLGSFAGDVPQEAAASRAPALRYGDVYEFRGAVIDQAGGLPRELARADEPWRLDLAKLIAPTSSVAASLSYRRAVPVGEVNVLPPSLPVPAGQPPRRAPWPALADDVALRAREFWADTHPGADSVPVLLMSTKPLPRTLSAYAFDVAPPATDEHTLMRWAIPALDDPNRTAVLGALMDALSALIESRTKETTNPHQLHDPAVESLGIRITGAGSDNAVAPVRQEIVTLATGAAPHQRKSVSFRVAAAPFGAAPSASVDVAASQVAITVPEGSFATVEIFPLVKESDFTARFADVADFGDLVDRSTPFAGHVAFRPAVVLVEGATAELPLASALYDAVALQEQNGGDVAIHFASSAPVEKLAFVDRFAIERERWVWRNLPVATETMLEVADLDERRRRAASGPPAEVFDPALRDTHPAVADWERLAGIDRGFVDRGVVNGRWPRVVATATEAGGPARDVLLSVDNRDAVSGGDYLRFGLRVRSRYAGVLAADARELTARSAAASVRKRIVVGFRGQKVKPPKILALVPLTASLKKDPLATPPGVPPFLVLLDETFFREYGIGERIELQLALENLDFQETPETAVLPYRTGAMPDHWMRSKYGPFSSIGRYRDPATIDRDENKRIALDLFGPFGYSLDLTPSEALANASAFIAYPPRDVGPHWAMFARLRRVLDRPSSTQRSEWSDVHALYTLPDARLLASVLRDDASLDLGATAVLNGLTLLLDPLAQLAAAADGPATNSEAASQYRYFLLVSSVIRGAGQSLEAELPLGIWRFSLSNASGFAPPGSFVVERRDGKDVDVKAIPDANGQLPALDTRSEYRGRVVEVLLNGRYDGPSRLDDTTTSTLNVRDFWEALLDARDTGEHDAAGMIRRVSDAFPVHPR